MRSEPGSISVAIPARNEEKYLPATLAALTRAREFLAAKGGRLIEILVVDNGSTDQTAQVAAASGARVIHEPEPNIAKVRNTGAKAASGEVLVFLDADTLVPQTCLWRIHQVMANPASVGGAVDTDYRPARFILKVYLWLYRLLSRATGMAQGAAQFYRRDIFFTLGGYDGRLFMGEDVDLFWRLKKLARQMKSRVVFIEDIQVEPSCRRYDQWPLWRTLVWTNPLLAALGQRQQRFWHGWYKDAPR
jgi:glycosyltransferase involved in cell wall biosynthesis